MRLNYVFHPTNIWVLPIKRGNFFFLFIFFPFLGSDGQNPSKLEELHRQAVLEDEFRNWAVDHWVPSREEFEEMLKKL